jgi:probable HAF family extracellular repeat protein
VTPLGDLGGQLGASARGLNNLNEVVGYSDTSTGFQQAFYWSEASGIVGLPGLTGGHYSRANAINNVTQIVGVADDASAQGRAVIWTRNGGVWQVMDLGTLSGGLTASASAISDTGYVTGQSGRSGGPGHAFLYFNGNMTDLGVANYPPQSGISEGLGVDSAGHAVGYAYAPLSGPDHAWYYDGTSQIDITPAGPSTYAHANAINSHGQIACTGTMQGGGTNGRESAIFTVGGSWVELGIVAGFSTNEALAINNSAQVVGRMVSDYTQTNSAYLYTGGTMYYLNDYTGYDVDLTEATGISDSGAITANAVDDLGISHAVLMRPDPCYANCDRSSVPPILNINDFQCFLNLFAVQSWRANCDLSTVSPRLNTNDFQCFLNKFAAGCT